MSKSPFTPSRPRQHKAVIACKAIEAKLMDARFGGHRLGMSGHTYYVVHESVMNEMIQLAANGRRR